MLHVWNGDDFEEMEISEAGSYPLMDGTTAFLFKDRDGRHIMTRVGRSVDLVKVLEGAPQGLVLEFGVAGGNSIRRLASTGRQIYGFDWWKGLPHDWNAADLKGACYAPKPDLPPNIALIDGLFSDTLEPFLLAHHDPVAFVHIDCDLYAATIYVLHSLMDRFVTGSIIAFDEIYQGHYGELEAWTRYLKETGQQWELVGNQHAFGEVHRLK